MCELMGLSFARPLSADVSIRTFASRGEENADGWGLAWYPDRAAAIVKEPVKWGESPFARFLEGYPSLRSSIYIAHVRHGTVGGSPRYADTHPFSRERMGREYCLAHNGTLEGPIWTLPTGRFSRLGATDSEQAFCHLMGELDNRGGHLDTPEDWRWLHERLAGLNRLGKLNLLFSDGVRLFAYHDLGAWKGLTFRKIDLDGSGEERHLGDANIGVDLKDTGSNHGHVVATYPLGAGSWTSFQTGELIVLEGGVMRFSSHRDLATAEPRKVDTATVGASAIG